MIVAFCLLHILLQNLSLEQGALNLLLLIRKFVEGILLLYFFVRLGPSPKLKIQLKDLDQSITLNSHITTTTHHQQTFLPVPGYTFS